MRQLLLLLFLLADATGAQAPRDFAYGVTLAAEGDSPFYQVELPMTVYGGAVRNDLGDMRVFNGDGAMVPFAFVPRSPPAVARSVLVELPIFALRVEQRQTDLNNLALTLNRTAAGGATLNLTTRDGAAVAGDRLIGYVFDASTLTEPLVALVATWTTLPRGVGMRFRIEASDDLASWRTIVSDAPLIDLEAQGRHLRRDRIELPAIKAKYLRLSWPEGQPPLDLSGISGAFAARSLDLPMQWSEVTAVALPGRDGDYEFDLLAAYPVERLAIVLPEQNTVVAARLSSRESPQATWQLRTGDVLYRLRQGDGEVTSPAIVAHGTPARYWRLQVDPSSGGLGTGLPRLRAGWLPQKIVFAARGSGPFVLAYGSATAVSNALPIQTLVPGYNTALAPAIAVALPRSASGDTLGGAERLTKPIDAKRWLLWSTLVLGVAVLGWMAWRLSRQMSEPPGTAALAPKPDDA